MLQNRPPLRYFIELSYLGTPFHGWQRQLNAISVQETVEDCLSKLLGQEIGIVGAGRTDTGVHAKQMFAHFDIEMELDTEDLTFKLNRFLKDDIHCFGIHKVSPDLHARFSAEYRTYKYYISTRKDPFSQQSAWKLLTPLDMAKLQEGAKLLFEYTDFESFSKVNTDVKTFLCEIRSSYWEQDGHLLCYTVSANRFLRNMVRAIVGTLVAYGSGKIEYEELKKIIESKNRSLAGESAPAHGLYLVEIGYPELKSE